MNQLVYWVWLSLRCGAGSEWGSCLLQHFASPKDIYEAKKEDLLAIDGIEESFVLALMDRSLVLPQKIVEYCEKVDVGILTLESREYPERLRSIYAKPIVLYYKGKLPNIDKNVLIACVGMRSCSQSGAQNAYRLGRDLVTAGAIVVSGLADGIDAAAQRGAVDAGGHTIAVLGCGIDRVYPPQNAGLMNQIANTGTLITEYAPGTAPMARNFPVRNRIISGLSQGTVVVEANVRSGSLITANYAVKQGRDIFAFPGMPDSSHAKGTNTLIRKGAKLVVCAADILEEYELLYPNRIFTENISMQKHRRKQTALPKPNAEEVFKQEIKSSESVQKRKETNISVKETASVLQESSSKRADACADAEGREILSVIRNEMSVDEIAATLSAKKSKPYDIGALLGALTVLEIEGFVCALPGGKYRLT